MTTTVPVHNPIDDFLRMDRIPHIWCPGCGIGTSVNSFARALVDANVDVKNLAVVSGIGCTGRVAGYVNLDSFHTTHGRAIPFATGNMATYLQSGGRDARLATAVYCGVIEGMGLASAALLLWAMRKGYMRVSALPAHRRRAALRFAAGSIAYIVAIGVAFASPVSAVVISGLVAAYYMFDQTPSDNTVHE